MWRKIVLALIILVLGAGVAFFVVKSEPKLNKNFAKAGSFLKDHPFRLGLDLSGGTHLIYKADVSAVPSGQVGDSMDALRDVIERRINLFGVSEPVVQVQNGGFISGAGEELIVDLPGVTDVKQAIAMIGQTPLLVFETEAPAAPQKITVGPDGKVNLNVNPQSQYAPTQLTGRYLQRATLTFDTNNAPTCLYNLTPLVRNFLIKSPKTISARLWRFILMARRFPRQLCAKKFQTVKR